MVHNFPVTNVYVGYVRRQIIRPNGKPYPMRIVIPYLITMREIICLHQLFCTFAFVRTQRLFVAALKGLINDVNYAFDNLLHK